MRNLVFGRGATDRRRRSVRKLEPAALSRYLSVESAKLQAQDAAMLKTDTRKQIGAVLIQRNMMLILLYSEP